MLQMGKVSHQLKIALISTARRWHGGEEQARLLAHGLQQCGHDCLIVARRSESFAQCMSQDGFSVVEFDNRGWNPTALRCIREALRRHQVDVVHYNDSHSITSGGFASIGLNVPARFASRRVDFPIRLPLRYRHFCDRILCVSSAVATVCVEGGIPAKMVRVIHDGVDPKRVRAGDRARGRQALRLADQQPLLLTVATLTDHKGHRFLLDAMPAVLKSFPEACLALAGDGELADALKQQAARLQIESNVRFLGFRDDAPDLIQAADLIVMPSHLEGLGSSLIDAMLAGRAIVSTTAGGLTDLVCTDTDETEPVAWTVPPRDPSALASAIIDALASPDLRTRRQQQARQRAEHLFTADRMVDATLAEYYRVLSGAA